MRKTLIIFLLLGGIALGIGIVNNLVASGEIAPSIIPSSIDNQSSSHKSLTVIENSHSDPIRLSIPKLGIAAAVEYVGLNDKGAMDIPKDDANVAWYKLGVKPGEKGNAVVAGHFDTKTGAPAVFNGLSKLKTGDEIEIEDKNGRTYKFVVTRVTSYQLEKFPLQEVFGISDKTSLNLITCDGVYDKTSKLYSQRLVVYSQLKSE